VQKQLYQSICHLSCGLKWLQSVPILYNGPPSLSQNCLFPCGDVDLNLIHGSLGPPESSTQTASRSVQLFLQGLQAWQTDRPCYSAASTYAVLRCGLIIMTTKITNCVSTRSRNMHRVVKVIWKQAALPPHMDGSMVFARWRQCAPHLTSGQSNLT